MEDTNAPDEEVKEELNEFTVNRMRKGKAKREAMAALKKAKEAKLDANASDGEGEESHNKDGDSGIEP